MSWLTTATEFERLEMPVLVDEFSIANRPQHVASAAVSSNLRASPSWVGMGFRAGVRGKSKSLPHRLRRFAL